MKNILTIAGSDCSGGAGIQADIKTITAHKHYAMSAITALTAQNTTGVYDIFDVSPAFVEKQIDCIFEDIRPDAVKIGMVSNSEIIRSIARKLKEYQAENVVVDPVMVSTSGSQLLSPEAKDALIQELLPLGTILTPNLPEAEVLCGFPIHSREEMEKAAKEISRLSKGAILIKGGHMDSSADDLLYAQGHSLWLAEEKISNENTHGTGCTLSSAIACNLAQGCFIEESVRRAKDYITGALRVDFNLGKGNGPLLHTYAL